MLMIKETQFTQTELDNYFSRGYRCATSDGVHFPKTYAREAVSFILDPKRLYAINIKNIEYLVNTNHPVNIKLGDKTWKHITKEEWRYSYKDDKTRRTYTIKHEVLLLFETKREEYFEKVNRAKAKDNYNRVTNALYPNGEPTEQELESFLDTWAKAYDIEFNRDDKLDMLNKAASIHYYLDHNIDIANPGTEPDVVYVGDENLFEDMVYKSNESDHKLNLDTFI